MERCLPRLLLVLLLSFSLAGCKLAVIVVEGGNVDSLSGSRDCLAGNNCVFQVTDTDFSETFTAVPLPGWRFLRWNSGGDFFCQDITSTQCVLSNTGAAGNPLVEAVIATEKSFYIMPVFEFVGDPITNTIVADGREWAQVTPFGDLTWSEINEVCPAGVCDDGLAGFDMRGWTWASVADVNSLFNHYIGFPALGPGPSQYSAGQFTFTTAVNADGWLGIAYGDTLAITGFTRDAPPASCSGIGIYFILGQDVAATGGFLTPLTECDSRISGGWFYREL